MRYLFSYSQELTFKSRIFQRFMMPLSVQAHQVPCRLQICRHVYLMTWHRAFAWLKRSCIGSLLKVAFPVSGTASDNLKLISEGSGSNCDQAGWGNLSHWDSPSDSWWSNTDVQNNTIHTSVSHHRYPCTIFSDRLTFLKQNLLKWLWFLDKCRF